MKRNSLHILVFLLIVAGSVTFVWMIQPGSNSPTEIAINEALSRLDRREFKEVDLKASRIEFTDINDKRFATTVSSDATRDLIVSRVVDLNRTGEGKSAGIKVSEEATSSGLGWLILVQGIPFLILCATIGLAIGLLASLLLRK